MKLARKADDLLLQGAEKILQAARSAAVSYPIDQDPRVLRLQGDRGLADLAFRGATDVLRLTQQTTDGAITLAGQTYNGLVQQLGVANGALGRTKGALGVVKSGFGALAGVAGYIAERGLGALLDVRSASFDGSLNSTSGGSVTLDADVLFQGNGLIVHVSYDFHDLVAGAKALAKAVVPSLPI